MSLSFTDENTNAWCSTCRRLGYCAERYHDDVHRPSQMVVADRSFEDFKVSARNGCHFCDIILQSFMLLQTVESGMQVELVLYSQSPNELHSLANGETSDVVEIYPCSGESKLFSVFFRMNSCSDQWRCNRHESFLSQGG